jgi:REP element-mobilizing transposase RayT
VGDTYFITFSTYGTRLHGDARGTVDRLHNRIGDPTVTPNEGWVRQSRAVMVEEPYTLDRARRPVVLTAICQHAGYRGWELLAAHVRTNHVHIVVVADTPPERVMTEFKAYASRALKATGCGCGNRWTRHGSTRWLKTPEAVAEKVHYTLFEQGEVMSVFAAPIETPPLPGGRGSQTPPLPGGRGSQARESSV